MKRNIILTIGLLGYLTYIFRYIKLLPQYPSPELLSRIIIWILIAIIITAKLFISFAESMAEPKTYKVKKAPKRKKYKSVTVYDKKFKKNYAKTSKKYKNEVQVPDLKSAYIESIWDEMKKN